MSRDVALIAIAMIMAGSEMRDRDAGLIVKCGHGNPALMEKENGI